MKATYNLEGDGPLVFTCFEIVDALSASIRVAHAPNVEAIAQVLSQGVPSVKQQLVDHAKRCAQPGFDYFQQQQLGSSLKGPLAASRQQGCFLLSSYIQCSQMLQLLTHSLPFHS